MSARTRMAQIALPIKALACIWFGILSVSLSIQFKKSGRCDGLEFSALFAMCGFCIAYGFESGVFITEIVTTDYSIWDNEIFSLCQFLIWNLYYLLSWASFYTFMILRIKKAFNTVTATRIYMIKIEFNSSKE